MYMMANGKMNEAEETKIATFLWLIGNQAMEIYETLFPNDGTANGLLGNAVANADGEQQAQAGAEVVQPPPAQPVQRTLDEVLRAFDGYCVPKKNTTMESYKFNTITQKEKQPFAEFETELRKQIQYCEFKCACGVSYENRMLRDRIIIGVHDKKLQLKLLDGKDQPLNNVVDTCKVFEAAAANKMLLDKNSNQVKCVTEQQQQSETVNAITRRCYNCGFSPFSPSHLRDCKANGVTCTLCSKTGHFSKWCKSKGNKSKTTDNKKGIKTITSSTDWNESGMSKSVKHNDESGKQSSINSCIYRLNTSINTVNKTRWTKAYQIGNQIVKFKIDTGADVNCVPLKLVKKLGIKLSCEQNDISLYDYSSNKYKNFGIANINCLDLKSKRKQSAQFIVVDDTFEPLLGLETSIKFNLVKRLDIGSVACSLENKEEFIKTNQDLFDGLGEMQGNVHIQLKENSKPVLHYKKRIPLSLVDKLKVSLEKMVMDKVISPVEYPTEWVNNLQVVEKPNGNLRICLDPKPLNACIKREHFLIPTIDDFTSRLKGKRFFTVLDLASGFWHMKLDEQSSDLTTFMTPFGRYKFHRVPFGLNCAPEMFQRKMVQLFGDIPGVVVYFDDICITAETEKEHDRLLTLVIELARANNVKFGRVKIQYRQKQVKFMGLILEDGQIKSPEKYRDAILKIKKTGKQK